VKKKKNLFADLKIRIKPLFSSSDRDTNNPIIVGGNPWGKNGRKKRATFDKGLSRGEAVVPPKVEGKQQQQPLRRRGIREKGRKRRSGKEKTLCEKVDHENPPKNQGKENTHMGKTRTLICCRNGES